MAAIVGHEHLVHDLTRLADGRDLSHAYLFWGPEKVGKRTVALALANYLQKGAFVYEEGRVLHDSLFVDSGEKSSIGIDAIRAIRNFLSQKPNISHYRTAIIDGGELLTDESQNALLKISEDPPPSALLILIAKDPESLKETIRSRFQKIYFPTVPAKRIAVWLREEWKVPKEKAESLAAQSFNQPGRALAILNDPRFVALHSAAKKFLSLRAGEHRDFLKSLVESDDFRFELFLDAVLDILAADKKRDSLLWHRAVLLRGESAYFNLNPRLQLESLARITRS